KNPDLIIHSVFKNGASVTHYNQNIPRICYIGENIKPLYKNNTMYFSYDEESDINVYFPIWQKICMEKNEYIPNLYNKIKHSTFEKFCSFVVSNPNNIDRNNLFTSLNDYKHVDSLGRFNNNNTLLSKYTDEDTWHENKINLLRDNKFKFNICFENTYTTGYITEKIMDSFLTGSIPIYKGANDVDKWFNNDSFINCNDYNNEDIIQLIKELDSNESLFNKYYNQPLFDAYQIIQLFNSLNNIEKRILNCI
ncbi:MAG: glycosyltransferase family 10, partial [Clostridia bacterium]